MTGVQTCALPIFQILGGAVLSYVGRVRGPVAIDNGIEEVLRFVASEPASFLVRVFCRGYDEGKYFEVHEPRCVCVCIYTEHGQITLRDFMCVRVCVLGV